MKKLALSLFFLMVFMASIRGQINAIFINDNSVNPESSETVFTLIEQYLGELALFDAVDEERSPDFSELESYNLVIWYCGTDEDNLYLWDGNYKDNPELMEYLDNGGNLWLMGRGFLNARYIKPPRNFAEDTFVYKYLGINKWTSESYTSDNGIGSPELLRAYATVVNTLTLEKIEWENPPERMVDGCELTEGCYEAYYFGPGGYPLYGQPNAFYLKNSLNENMILTFDPYQMNSKGNLSTLLSDILRFYEDVLSDVDELAELRNSLKIYPNPADEYINIEFVSDISTQISLTTLTGRHISEKIVSRIGEGMVNAQIDVKQLGTGVYLLTLENSKGNLSRKVFVDHR